MGFENNKAWQRNQENAVIRAESNELNVSDLIERSRVQAERNAQAKENAMHIKTFINSGQRDSVLESKNQMSAAKAVIKSSSFLVPEIIDDTDEQAAYLIALAEETSKPEYNQ